MSCVQLVVWVISRSQKVFCSPSNIHSLPSVPGSWKKSQGWSRTKKEGERPEGTRKRRESWEGENKI